MIWNSQVPCQTLCKVWVWPDKTDPILSLQQVTKEWIGFVKPNADLRVSCPNRLGLIESMSDKGV